MATKPPGMQASIIPCQSKTRRVVAEIAFGEKWENDGVGASTVKMGWHPDGLSVRLPLLCSPVPQNPEDGEQ